MTVITLVSDCEILTNRVAKFLTEYKRDTVCISLMDPVWDTCSSCTDLSRNKYGHDSSSKDYMQPFEKNIRDSFGPNHLIKATINSTRQFLGQGQSVIITDVMKENELRGLRVIFASIVIQLRTRDGIIVDYDYIIEPSTVDNVLDQVISDIFE